MGLGKLGLDDHVDPLVGVGQGPDVLGGGPARVALADGQDGRVVPLGDERDIVHGPLDAGADGQAGLLVVLGAHVAHFDGDVRDQVGRVLVVARVGEVAVGRGGRVGSRGAVVADDSEDVINVVVVRARLLGDGAHPKVARRLSCGDDDIITLAHTNA